MVRSTASIWRALALTALAAALLWSRVAAAQEPMECLSGNPADWPQPAKPYIMIAFDTSGSMTQSVASENSCGYPDNRLGHGRCSMKNTFQAFAGQVNFGLAHFARDMFDCDGGCFTGCRFRNLPDNVPALDTVACPFGGGCGPKPDGTDPLSASRAGANLRVEVLSDLFPPPPGGNVADLLAWVDDDCSDNRELFADGCTPLNGILRDVFRYYADEWTHPAGAPTFVSPLGTSAQGERGCRSLNVILVTDGAEKCDSEASAIDAAAELYAGFERDGVAWKVKTHVIDFGFVGGLADDIAVAGGTGSAYDATDEVELSRAFSRIISEAIRPEICDNADNDCNGCTDEGYRHYCNVGQDCCVWSTAAERDTCIADYVASLPGNPPDGDLTKLPCITAAERDDPSTWLCYNPGDICDETDNNCVDGADEKTLKCGDPAHCPREEECNAQDDDCDGQIDEDGVCGTCLPTEEICNGCDDDCDGVIDNPPPGGFAELACGLPAPANCLGSVACQEPQTVMVTGTCVMGAGYGTCDFDPATEVCDGVDNDCSGVADDNLDLAQCVPAGHEAGLDYGPLTQCELGMEVCKNGAIVCEGGVGPSDEVCDGVDNDCDGMVDEGAVGVGEQCGVGNAPCVPGVVQCVAGALACVGGVPPQAEVCDGLDNDCDGGVDEAGGLTDAPANGGCWTIAGDDCGHAGLTWSHPPGATCHGTGTLSAPCIQGTLVCAGAAGWACVDDTLPGMEVCDGVDNDCNDFVDDGDLPQVGGACGSSVGECEEGTIACDNGALDCVDDVPPVPEQCDGFDNNCNGDVDEGIPPGDACVMAFDAELYPGDRDHLPCRPGVLVCDGAGNMVCAGGVGPQPELCDGVDNDCDAQVDETGLAPDGIDGSPNPLPPPHASIGDACGTEEGQCEPGVYGCVVGQLVCQGDTGPAVEICDCVDNDCDGEADELPGDGEIALCSPGKSCVQGSAHCQCAAPCKSGEFPCPTGHICQVVKLSGSEEEGSFCIADHELLCGDCAARTITDAQGVLFCAPEGTDDPGCKQTPTCVCKAPGVCQAPCTGVVCPAGKVCSSFGSTAGQCVDDTCYQTGCVGCNKVCDDGVCKESPCTEGTCPAGEVCKPTDAFSSFTCSPSCAGVSCATGTACVSGECVADCDPPCAAGQVCDRSGPVCVADRCVEQICPDGACCDPLTGACGACPCEGVLCPQGEICLGGECLDPVATDPATGAVVGAGGGGAASGAGGASIPLDAVWRLPSGGGGCLCEVGNGGRGAPATPAAALVGLVLLMAARRRREPGARWPSLLALAVLAGGAETGCVDEPVCYGTDCERSLLPAGVTESGNGGGGISLTAGQGGSTFSGGQGGGPGCQVSNDGVELCDGIDNDCDGDIDEDFDFTSIRRCGACSNDCAVVMLNVEAASITCEWSGTPGEPGTCAFTDCAEDYHDLDGDGVSCEYYCAGASDGDGVCNHTDDDCDGLVDEDVDLCGDPSNCGQCNRQCNIVHGSGGCEPTEEEPDACTPANTRCVIASCDDDDGNGLPDWHDLDGSVATGCEYRCEVTNGGVEVCGDGIDNDCDGLIDGADDLSGDPAIGVECFGDTQGVCSEPDHAGVTACHGDQVVCAGDDVLFEDDQLEMCNGQDDDCDGVVDDTPSDAGGACGQSNIFPCKLGTELCVGGALVCTGAVDPKMEICDGKDNDCDGEIDLIGADPPVDVGKDCNVPVEPPDGATSPCKAGLTACNSGVLSCQGSVGPTSSIDGCGDDSNCDGVLDNQPDLMTTVQHCGECGKDCRDGKEHAVFTCVAGACQFQGCEPGYYDFDGDESCTDACIFNGPEQCNGFDDDCNGVVDDVSATPSPVQVCGVSPAATRAECTNMVVVSCMDGGWACTFPAGVCDPDCAGADEVCDNLDNDCDGSFNENVPSFGKPCFSDAGLAPPGHGACRTQGIFVCDGDDATVCSATKADCVDLAEGCEERCDGVDNDCDGLVDESFLDKGDDPDHFVRPAVTRIGDDRWVFSYEASRPGASTLTAGSGNGYHCAAGDCPAGVTDAPVGVVLDETLACSEPGRLPWFNVTPVEVEQTCFALGGFICDTSDWVSSCEAEEPCLWGYTPRGAACTSPATSTKLCNLQDFDFDELSAGLQNGLLLTASDRLLDCAADWTGLQGNMLDPYIFDLTGNLMEITSDGEGAYRLLGGGFQTAAEDGAACNFDFYVVETDFRLFDTGFRCCFDADPRQ